MYETPARLRLVDALKGSGRSQSWLATQLDVKQPSVWSWFHGHSRPEHHFRLALQNLLGIPADAWMTPREREIAGLPPLPDEPAPDTEPAKPAAA